MEIGVKEFIAIVSKNKRFATNNIEYINSLRMCLDQTNNRTTDELEKVLKLSNQNIVDYLNEAWKQWWVSIFHLNEFFLYMEKTFGEKIKLVNIKD